MTSPRPLTLSDVARRLLEHEGQAAPETAEQAAKALLDAQARLRGVLAGVVGDAGLDALLYRSVRLAKLPCGAARASGSHAAREPLAGLVEWLHSQPAEEAAQAAYTWLTTFLELLSSFIGEGLTLRLINHAWSGELEFPPPPSTEKT